MFLDLKLEGRLILLVGAGRVGRRKLRRLLAAGAKVIAAEPRPGPELLELARAGRVDLRPRFTEELLAGVSLLFAASDDPELNRAAIRAARARGVWVNAADSPEESDFFLPAVVDRGAFQLAVGTRGASPALAAGTAARLRAEFGPEYGRLARWLGRLRPLIINSPLGGSERRLILENLAASRELLDCLARGRLREVEELTRRLMAPLEIEGPLPELPAAEAIEAALDY